MQGEITRKSVLLECLEYERGLWKLCSKNYDTLEPMKGMDKEFDEQREKCRILEDLIHAYESEPVKRALATWQQEQLPPENIAEEFNGHTEADVHSDTEKRAVSGGRDYMELGIEMEPLRL